MADAFLNSHAQVRGDSRADRSPRLTAFPQLSTIQDRLIAAITGISAGPDVIGAMDEMLADLISEGTLEGLEAARARGRTGGRKPKLTTRQADVARQMYDEKGVDGKCRYTVAEIAETFHVSRKTIYRHLQPTPAATSSPTG